MLQEFPFSYFLKPSKYVAEASYRQHLQLNLNYLYRTNLLHIKMKNQGQHNQIPFTQLALIYFCPAHVCY